MVEVLMAAVVAALLFAGFSAPFRGAWVVWARTMDGLEGLSQQRAMLERVAQDLTNAVVWPTEDGAQPSLQFEVRHLQLYTVQPAHTEGRPARLWRVEYAVEEAPDGHALVRRTRPFGPAAPPDAMQRLLTRVEDVRFRYGSPDPGHPTGIRWSVVWEDERTMPRYVEVTVQSPGRMPVRHRLHIPAGGTGHET
ncbi:MAG: hypothetical protein HYY91_05065 [Candidatus Omnitrophica bacterium]|nr:hypothetical protein [Candidatus Omnitrophota bacterium]